jgi:sporulation protein YunB
MTLGDRRLVPAAVTVAEYRMSARLNEAINEAILSFREKSGGEVTAEDLYSVTRGSGGEVLSMSANTILINEICADLSRFINENLTEPQLEHINVPIGALLGVGWLANVGPSYRITVMPVGVSNVQYETSFEAVGINQVNFQVNLTISAAMKVVNPLQTDGTEVVRKAALVNTVFAGEIPGMYIQ